MDDGFNV